MKLDKFENKLLKLLQKEHFRRNGFGIVECPLEYCWFKKMRALIIDDLGDF